MPFTIRDATKEDLPSMVSIWMQGQGNLEIPEPQDFYLKHFTSLYQHIQSSPNHGFWIAEEDGSDKKGKILGWASLVPYDGNPIYTYTTGQSSCFISPDAKYSGLGKALMKHCCLWADNYLQWVVGHIRVGNIPSESLGASVGFKLIGHVAPHRRLWLYTSKKSKL